MKIVLVALALVFGAWLWRRGRGAPPSIHKADEPPRPKPPSDPATQDMVACGHCGVHLPRSEACQGNRDWYCGEDHRRQSEA